MPKKSKGGKKRKRSRSSKAKCARSCGGRKINVKMIKRHMPYLLTILKNIKNKKQKDGLIDNITTSQLNTVKHLVQCFLNHKIHVAPDKLKKLKRDRRFLYVLAKNYPAVFKKKVLKQKGGILGPLLGALGPALIQPAIGVVGKVLGLK